MKTKTLKALYLDQLRDLYSMEQQILEAMPTMIDKAEHAALRDAFTTHELQTQEQARRLENIFGDLSESPRGHKCEGMKGILAENESFLKDKPSTEVIDAGLIAGAQRVEHYEMAGYGTARAFAELLGYPDHAALLQRTLDEESETDRLLTNLAVSTINADAAIGDVADREAPRAMARETGGDASAMRERRRPGTSESRP